MGVHDQVPGYLGGPCCGGVSGHTEDADAAGGVVDDGEDVEPRSGQGVGVEEVGGEEGVGLVAQERGPGEVVAVGRGPDAVGCEDLPDRGGGDLDSEGGEFAVDSSVSPAGVVVRTTQDEARMPRTVGGGPGRVGRDALAWRRRGRSRCQRRIVSGEMIRGSWRSVGLGIVWSRAARNTRAEGVSRGLSTWRCRTASWWRSARISMSLSVLLLGSNRGSVIMPVRAR
jgi:hypothetical protein